MIKVLFFAQTRELLNTASLELDLTDLTGSQLCEHLSNKGDVWAKTLQSEQLLMAVNQEMVSMDTMIVSGDEVAFFPPVTGG